jgi:NAD(P)-dependent dehydrogenase (short-subunit alcohol dehydrogenase family)
MDCGMMSGIGLRIFFPGVRGMSAVRRQTIGSSPRRFSIAIGRAFPGAICRCIVPESLCAVDRAPLPAHYSVSKFAIAARTQALAREIAPH